jgi:hypothetical protein
MIKNKTFAIWPVMMSTILKNGKNILGFRIKRPNRKISAENSIILKMVSLFSVNLKLKNKTISSRMMVKIRTCFGL